VSDQIAIEVGRDPWLPSSDAELVDVLHSFTIPLVGIVAQGGQRYLFWCVAGHAAPEQVWAYGMADDPAVDALSAADGPESFAAALRAAAHSSTVFAMATDSRGISVSVVLDEPADFDSVYEIGMRAIQEKIREANEEYETLRRNMPRLPSHITRPTPRPIREESTDR